MCECVNVILALGQIALREIECYDTEMDHEAVRRAVLRVQEQLPLEPTALVAFSPSVAHYINTLLRGTRAYSHREKERERERERERNARHTHTPHHTELLQRMDVSGGAVLRF